MKYLLLSIIFISACAPKPKDPRDITSTNAAFASYIGQFESYYGKSIGNVPVNFKHLSNNTIGVCTVWSNGYKQIAIDPEFWSDEWVSENERRSLIFHELGHCVLGLQHDETMIDWYEYYIPRSIMYPVLVDSFSYDYLQPYYIDQLFHSHTSKPTGVSTDLNDDVTKVEYVD